MRALQKLVRAGYGETELHLHHFNDTEESARERFQQGSGVVPDVWLFEGRATERRTSGSFTETGAWTTAAATHSAETIASWRCCASLGCFADFTFSSIFEESQPPSVNNIYEATDDAGPKSYDAGVPLRRA